MITVKADERRRVSLPGAKPRQVFSYTENRNGTITLTPVEKPEPTDLSEAAAETWEKLGPAPRVNYDAV